MRVFVLASFLLVGAAAGDEGQGLRVSARKCLEYKEFYRESFAPRVPGRDPIVGKIKCPPNPRIKNQYARRGVFKNEFPHMASLWYEMVNDDRERTGFKFRCSGSLISRRHVLVPGHCIYSRWGKPTHVVFGDSNLYSERTQGARQVVPIADIIMHPNYVPPSSTDDIAIVMLQKGVKYDAKSKNPRPSVRPACLPQVDQDVSGGALLSAFENGGDGPFKVERVEMLLNNKDCEPHLLEQQGLNFTIRFGDALRPSMMCSQGMPSETCLTDMGATLMLQPMRGMPCMDAVVGILAVNATACNDGKTHPLVFTKIDRYLDWIEGIIWPKLFKYEEFLRSGAPTSEEFDNSTATSETPVLVAPSQSTAATKIVS